MMKQPLFKLFGNIMKQSAKIALGFLKCFIVFEVVVVGIVFYLVVGYISVNLFFHSLTATHE